VYVSHTTDPVAILSPHGSAGLRGVAVNRTHQEAILKQDAQIFLHVAIAGTVHTRQRVYYHPRMQYLPVTMFTWAGSPDLMRQDGHLGHQIMQRLNSISTINHIATTFIYPPTHAQ
jgi:hypothetical protein